MATHAVDGLGYVDVVRGTQTEVHFFLGEAPHGTLIGERHHVRDSDLTTDKCETFVRSVWPEELGYAGDLDPNVMREIVADILRQSR